jgi:hypothetical protein
VQSIGLNLAAQPQVSYWIMDLISLAVLRAMQRRSDTLLTPDSRMRFAPANGVAFFEPLGWKRDELFSLIRSAVKLKRLPWQLRLVRVLPKPKPDKLGHRSIWSAVINF